MTPPVSFKKAIAAGLVSLAGITGLTQAQEPPSDSVVHLPATAIFATENNGKFAVITDTGRFIIQGTVYDVWDQKSITTLDEARWAATHIPLDKANVGFDDLAPMRVGSGDKPVYLFSDLQCGFCKQLIDEARKGLPSGYRLEVILLPLLSEQSAQRTAEINCAVDEAQAWQVAMSGDMSKPLAQKPEDQCDQATPTRRMITAQFIGARNVPFMIRDDGLIQQGMPQNGLRDWIQSNR